MRRTVLGLLVLAGAVVAQTRPPGVAISELLMSLNDPGVAIDSASSRLADLLLEGKRRNPPSRPVVESFSRSLVAGLAGKQLTQQAARNLSTLIENVVAGVEPNFVGVKKVRDALGKIGIDEMRQDQISRRLMAIGEHARGPDDLPARVPLLQRPRN
jgi:hypothetical protein